MNTILLLSEAPIDPSGIAAVLADRMGASARLTSSSGLAIERGDGFATVLVDDGILRDYEDGELEAAGLDRQGVHAGVIAFRTVRFLREILEALEPELRGAAWIDDDHGTILPLGEFLGRTVEDSMLRQIANAVIEEARDDVVGLWAIHWDVREALPQPNDDEARDATLRVVEMILNSGATSGAFSNDASHTFHPWQISASEVLQRIRVEWANLGRAPDIGEIAWFVMRPVSQE